MPDAVAAPATVPPPMPPAIIGLPTTAGPLTVVLADAPPPTTVSQTTVPPMPQFTDPRIAAALALAASTPEPAAPEPTAPPLDRTFSDLLRAHRVRAGLTQRALADLSTISPRAIRDIEAGRAHARAQTVLLLADALRLQGLVRELFVHTGLGHGRPGPLAAEGALAVPKPVNALLGRDTEVRAMVEVLESGRRRMVSVSGLPGVGKTRVAADVAARLTARRDWPVLWIGAEARCLAGPGGGQLGPLLHAVRRLLESGSEDVARVCALVGRHELLLVLDGLADHRVPHGVEELLAYCPGVRVISTSRAPWRVAGVQTSVLAPLATPGPDAPAVFAAPPSEPPYDGHAAAPEARSEPLAAVPSVRLLVDRLAEVRPGFTLTPANARAVAQICRRLDGLPLALEAVAERFRVLSLQQLTELPTRELLGLTVPTRPGRAPETIGALIGAGFAQLGARHRGVLRALVGFDRPWTVTEAATVLDRPVEETVEDLSVLIGCGLVRSSHGEPATDLHIPNLLRAFLLRQDLPDPTFVGLWASHTRTHAPFVTRSRAKSGGDGMTYNATEVLRGAGILGGQMTPELEEFYSGLTKEETELLISLKSRLISTLPEVVAHSQEWITPEANQLGFDAAMLCACGLWSGSGANQK